MLVGFMVDSIVTGRFDNSSILDIAIAEALRSAYHFKVGAIIFKGKKVYSVAHNGVRSSSVPRSFKQFTESLHAEAHAIIKYNGCLKGKSILVVRVSNSGKLLNSRPCNFCYDFIRYKGIKHLFYSCDNKIKYERILI